MINEKNEGVPVIFNILQSNIVSLYGSIKCYVIFFIHLFYFMYYYFLSFIKEELGFKAFYISNISRGLSRQRGIIDKGKRCYSSSALRSNSKINFNKDKRLDSHNEKKYSRKNLSSPESRSYIDLYKGRGKPKSTPV